MQFELTNPPPPSMDSVGLLQVIHVLHNILRVLRSSTLFRRGGGWGKLLVKAVFMSVYLRLTANSIQKHVKRGGVPKNFGQDCSFYHVHCVSKRGKVGIKVTWTKILDFSTVNLEPEENIHCS